MRSLNESHSITILLAERAKSTCPITAAVVAALTRHARKLPMALRRSQTWDRGLEMAKHKTFTVATTVKVYFCDLQSPWQRGSNENTNGLLRQYFPRETDLSGDTQSELDKVALRLNQRPRKTVGFQTPASKLQAIVASTHRDHPTYRARGRSTTDSSSLSEIRATGYSQIRVAVFRSGRALLSKTPRAL
jgi:IS30 family transposase